VLDNILIPDSHFAAHDDEVKAKTNTIVPPLSVDLDNASYGRAFRRYLLLSHWPELLENTAAAQGEALLYNKYYWFTRFARLYRAYHGPDAGIEQQAFQMLDQTMFQVDWQVIEAIEDRLNLELS
jgi:hypothetical protein